MSDICPKNMGHGHRFNRPYGNTYQCQWCKALQSDIEATVLGDKAALDRLRVRNWTRGMSDAWHRHIPDTEAAFDALIEAAYKEVKL
jgi:hypothetical protein